MSRNGARDQRNGRQGHGGPATPAGCTWPTVMALEERRLMATFTVTNTADSGAGSLPSEIGLANSTAGANTVDFDCGDPSTPLTIDLTDGPLELSNTSGW